MPAPDDYVDVAERIREFKERYPDGTLQDLAPPALLHIGEKTFVVVQAAAYRTPDDARPGIGTAWEPVPGPTPFTRNSELQNAQTAAWGRAIIAVGIPAKKIASSEEVRNRQAETGLVDTVTAARRDPPNTQTGGIAAQRGKHTPAQMRKLMATLGELRTAKPDVDWDDWLARRNREKHGVESKTDLTVAQMGETIDRVAELVAEHKQGAAA